MQIGGMFSGSLSLILSSIGCFESHEIFLGASGLTRSDAEEVDVLNRAGDAALRECLANSEVVPNLRRVALVTVVAIILAVFSRASRD